MGRIPSFSFPKPPNIFRNRTFTWEILNTKLTKVMENRNLSKEKKETSIKKYIDMYAKSKGTENKTELRKKYDCYFKLKDRPGLIGDVAKAICDEIKLKVKNKVENLNKIVSDMKNLDETLKSKKEERQNLIKLAEKSKHDKKKYKELKNQIAKKNKEIKKIKTKTEIKIKAKLLKFEIEKEKFKMKYKGFYKKKL